MKEKFVRTKLLHTYKIFYEVLPVPELTGS